MRSIPSLSYTYPRKSTRVGMLFQSFMWRPTLTAMRTSAAGWPWSLCRWRSRSGCLRPAPWGIPVWMRCSANWTRGFLRCCCKLILDSRYKKERGTWWRQNESKGAEVSCAFAFVLVKSAKGFPGYWWETGRCLCHLKLMGAYCWREDNCSLKSWYLREVSVTEFVRIQFSPCWVPEW